MPHPISRWPRRLAIIAILALVLVVAVYRLVPRQPLPGSARTAAPTPTSTSPALPQGGTSAYTSPNLGVTLSYPSAWLPDGADRFAGPDGFFEMHIAPSMTPVTLSQTCEQEAAHAERYGMSPWISPISPNPNFKSLLTCFIQNAPEPTQGKASALIIAIPGSGVPVIFFTLRTDPPHFETIVSSLKLPVIASIPETPNPAPQPIMLTPANPPASIQPVVTSLGPLVGEEYPLVSSAVDTPSHFEFSQRIPSQVLAKRSAWRGSELDRLAQANVLLAPYGYTLRSAGSQAYDLIGPSPTGEALIKQVSTFWPPSVGAKDFAMLVEETGGKGQTFLVRSGSISAWQPMSHDFVPPVLIGERLFAVAASPTPGRVDLTADSSLIADNIVYTHYSDELSIEYPVKGLSSWDGRWVLEVAGDIIIAGQSLNRQQGYLESFGWQLIAGKPFYFFRSGDAVQISYAGAPLPLHYDQVIHDRCCEPAAFNNASSTHMAWFYALKDGVWNYVEIGIYP